MTMFLRTRVIEEPPSAYRPFGLCFSHATADDIVHQVCDRPLAPNAGVRLLVTANLDHIVQLRCNPDLRLAYDHAWRRTIDGAPVYLYARLRGARVPGRVTGADLCPQILDGLRPGSHRPFLVLATEALSDWYRQWFIARGFYADDIKIQVPPFEFERDEAFSRRLASAIRAHGTTHLFFGVGCPTSEVWIDRHREWLGDLHAFAFGAGFEFFAGMIRRAPPLLRRMGFEWAWRVLQDPKRLFRRYFIDSWAFLLAIADDIANGRVAPTPKEYR